MSEPKVTNATFVIERELNASPARVFAAFATLESKNQWFGAHHDAIGEVLARDLDFREGGKERYWARWKSGMVSDFQAAYHDIVENERIVLVYDMYVDGTKLSTSLMTIELVAQGARTRLIHTEQGSYFVGGAGAVASREEGTAFNMDALALLFSDAAASV